jgi:putative phosphoribosyl transferase
MFATREDAGQKLGERLKEIGIHADIALGLPRGGVVVAAAVAKVLDVALDVLIVRKIGHPWHREFAVGALAENGVVLLDESAVGRNPLIRYELNQVIKEEKQRLRDYEQKFHLAGELNLTERSVLLVDDGIATGATTEAAIMAVKQMGAAKVIVTAPVASTHAVERLSKAADGVVVIDEDPEFQAVGHYYQSFSQTTDEEVLALLRAENQAWRA